MTSCEMSHLLSLLFIQVLNLFLALLLNAFARESLQGEAEKRKEARPSKFYKGVQRLSKVLRIGRIFPRRGTQVKPQANETHSSAHDESVKDGKGKEFY